MLFSFVFTASEQVVKEMIGPYQLLKSGTIDLEAGTITLPLYRGSLTDRPSYNIWSVPAHSIADSAYPCLYTMCTVLSGCYCAVVS